MNSLNLLIYSKGIKWLVQSSGHQVQSLNQMNGILNSMMIMTFHKVNKISKQDRILQFILWDRIIEW